MTTPPTLPALIEEVTEGETRRIQIGIDTLDGVYLVDHLQVLAINAALAARRPLLLRGEPGCGKSRLAWAAAASLGWAIVPYTVDAHTEPRDLLWSVDEVARLAEAQIQGSNPNTGGASAAVDVMRFVQPGPMWWAFEPQTAKHLHASDCQPLAPNPGCTAENGVVVLIDEIDKADPSVPNGLLDALGHRSFAVRGRGAVEQRPDRAPLVIITTNEDRALPDAFLRRCLVHHLGLPDNRPELLAFLQVRGRAHFPKCAPKVIETAAEVVAEDREALGTAVRARPGVAEFLDLLRVVTTLRQGEAEQRTLLMKVKDFALRKQARDP